MQASQPRALVAHGRPPFTRPGSVRTLLVAAAVGMIVAAGATAVLAVLKPVWIVLLLAAGVTLIGSWVVRDAWLYWLALFVLAIPLNVHKHFASGERVMGMIESLGLPWGTTTFFVFLSDLPLLVLIGFWLRRLVSGETLRWPRIAWLPVAFLIWAGTGALFSPFPMLTVLELVRQCKFVLIFVLTINTIDPRKAGRFLMALLLAGLVLQSTMTLARYGLQMEGTLFGSAFGDESDRFVPNSTITGDESERERAEGTFGHPNATALHFEFVLPIAAAMLVTGPGAALRLTGGALLAVGLAGTYVTFSRGAMVGLLVAFATSFVVATRRGRIPRRMVAASVGVLLALVPVVAYKLHAYLGTRPEAYEQRFAHFEVGFAMLGFNPIVGTGLNTSTAIRQRMGSGWGSADLIDDQWPIHDHYLIGLIETGLPGTLLYVGFFVLVGLEALGRTRSRDPVLATLALAIFTTYVSLAVHMIIDFLSQDGLHTLLWMYAGLIVAMRWCEPEARPAMVPKATPAGAVSSSAASSRPTGRNAAAAGRSATAGSW